MNKKKARKGPGASKLIKVLTASLVLNPALYMLTFEKAFVEAVSTSSYKAPFVSKALPNFHTGVGKPLTLDLNEYFGGISSYSASASNLTGFAATVSGSALTLTNTRTGTFTVSVTGMAANGGIVSDTFDVAVIPDGLDKDNDGRVDIGEIVAYSGSHPMTKETLNETLTFIAPQKLTSPNMAPQSLDTPITVYKNSPITLSPTDLFSDDDMLTFEDSISLTPTGFGTKNLSNNQLTITALQHGSMVLDIAVKDARGGKASNRYNVTVGNRSPVFTGTDVTVSKNTYTPIIDLHTLFNDPDGDSLQFGDLQVNTSANAPVQIERTNDTFRLFGAAMGSTTVTANASDAYGGMTTGTFNVTVTNATYVNHPPQYNTGSNKLVNMAIDPTNDPNAYHPFTIDLENAFTDQDNDPITYTATSSTISIAVTSISDHLLTVTPQAGAHGKTTVTVTANDHHGGVTSYSFDLLFNRVPTFTGSLVASSNPIQHLSKATVIIDGFDDADDGKGSLIYSAISDLGGSLSVTTALSSTSDVRTAYISGLTRGSNTVSLTAKDQYGGNRTANFTVDVNNNKPMVKKPIYVLKGNSVDIVASDIFTDLDGDTMVLTAFQGISTTGLVTASFTSGTLSVTANGTGTGSGLVFVTVDDLHGGKLTTTNYGENDLPVIVYNPLPDMVSGQNVMQTINPSEYFSGFTSFTVESSDPNVAAVSGPDGGQYYLQAGNNGTTMITVKAYDSDGVALITSFEFRIIVPL